MNAGRLVAIIVALVVAYLLAGAVAWVVVVKLSLRLFNDLAIDGYRFLREMMEDAPNTTNLFVMFMWTIWPLAVAVFVPAVVGMGLTRLGVLGFSILERLVWKDPRWLKTQLSGKEGVHPKDPPCCWPP